MKYARSRVATTHIDRHNDRFTRECLEGMVDQINSQYVLMMSNHDPRAFPLGRVIAAELVELPDGEYAVETICETWEKGDCVPFEDNGRQMPLWSSTQDTVDIVYDRSYSNPEDIERLQEMSKSTGSRLSYYEKKAFEPISVLMVSATAVLANVATGFLTKMGEDAWDLFKEQLGALVERKKEQEREHLFHFVLNVQEDERTLAVETILTDPSRDEIEAFMSEGLEYLEMMAPEYFAMNCELVRVVHEFSDGTMHLSYGVRKDAVPVVMTVSSSSPASQSSEASS